MTTKKKEANAKSLKSMKIAKFVIDILGVYKSTNATPIALDDAMNLLKQNFSVKQPPKIQKCVMQILSQNGESCRIVIKSSEKNKTLETFDIESVETPSCGQINIGRYKAQDLVFLPILNKDSISELFIFHPSNATAQDVVITIAKLLDNHHSRKLVNGNQTQSIKREHEHTNQDDIRSLYSVSSNFINNWYGKLEEISPLQPNSNSSLASVNEELYLLNQNLKEIREFMKEVFQIIHNSVHNKKVEKKINGTNSETIHLPPKPKFIDIVVKIKVCLNLAAIHEEIIMNPSSIEIINQLFLFLRIIGDITINRSTRNPDLVSNVINPSINSSTVKFFTNHLNGENARYWAVLGTNYGFINFRSSLPNNLNRNYIDEFQIRKTPLISEYEDKYPSLRRKEYQIDSYRASPLPIVDHDFTYRSIPRMCDHENRPHNNFLDADSLQYQRPASVAANPNWRNHSHHSTWDDRQCRFIDAVQLRNGRLGKVIYDRSVQNYRELSVSSNEVVEILKDYGDKYSIKNALGEIGDCPKAIIHEIDQSLN